MWDSPRCSLSCVAASASRQAARPDSACWLPLWSPVDRCGQGPRGARLCGQGPLPTWDWDCL